MMKKNKELLENIIQQCRSITCLNGDMPEPPYLYKHLPYIAADGGAHKLLSCGIKPNTVVGDIDSLSEIEKDIDIIINKDDNFTDFEKTLFYLKANNLLPTIVYGINGGCIDRIFHNMIICFNHNVPFLAPPVLGITLQKTTTITLETNTKLSIFGNGIISTNGLKWDLRNTEINFHVFSSCSNRTKKETVTFDILQGKILLMIYLDEFS